LFSDLGCWRICKCVLSLLFVVKDVLSHFKHKWSNFGFCVDTQILCFIEIILGVPLIFSTCPLSMMKVCLDDGHAMHFGFNSSDLHNSSMVYFSLIKKTYDKNDKRKISNICHSLAETLV